MPDSRCSSFNGLLVTSLRKLPSSASTRPFDNTSGPGPTPTSRYCSMAFNRTSCWGQEVRGIHAVSQGKSER